MCAPLGASIAFKGIEGAIPLLHGSQGCATYIRRYVISHFKEPMDVASSSFSESTAIFGGKDNLKIGLDSIMRQYTPSLIGIASTCLSETIGEDIPRMVQEYIGEHSSEKLPAIVPVSTPSYAGTHMDGFHAAVKAVVESLAEGKRKCMRINMFPGFVSPADIRHVKEILGDFKLPFTLLPDYSETLDAPAWDTYHHMTEGGTPLQDIRAMGEAYASIEFGGTLTSADTAANQLKKRFGVERHTLVTPIGIENTDRFFHLLETISGTPTPELHQRERGRLVDSYFDAHKYVFGKKAVVYGEVDLVLALATFLAEIGVVPALCATGAENGKLAGHLHAALPDLQDKITVLENVDFMDIDEAARCVSPDLIIGNSKGYPLARSLSLPLIRVGFPIHDRMGSQRQLHIGYRGTQQLFDTITNSLIKNTQDASPVGYMYM